MDAAAVALDQRLLTEDVGRLVEHQVRVLRALHVDVRSQRLDGRDRRRLVHDGDVVDDFERGNLAGPVLLPEAHGPLLCDVLVARDRHDEQIAKTAGVLEMEQVAHVDQVERAVAEHDRFVAEPLPNGGQIGQCHDLLALAVHGIRLREREPGVTHGVPIRAP